MHIVYYPDPILLRPAARVESITHEVREKAAAMPAFMALEKGVGLAAPQVGWSARVLVASEDGDAARAQVLINPEIVRKDGGTEWGEEGCLSFPEIFGEVSRWRDVVVRATDLDGHTINLAASGFFARVLQHEIDHLNGILFITKMRAEDRTKNRPRLQELVLRFQSQRAVPEPRA